MTTATHGVDRRATWLATVWRSLRMATWLGWQIETNWADALVFAVYLIIRPVASAMILVVMYNIITDGATEAPIFSYIYLGNAFYIYVTMVMTGVSWAVIDDREHYQMLKYVYVAPINYPVYLVGRGFTRFLSGTVSVLITMLFGVLLLDVTLAPFGQIDWLLFFAALGLGLVALVAMGMTLAAVTLMIANHVWFVGDAVAGALYLFSGAIFPLDVLPAWLRPVGFAMPLTYWLELIRRALLGEGAAAFPTLAHLSNAQLFGILGGITVFFMVVAYFAFGWCDRQARERGMIDMVTNY